MHPTAISTPQFTVHVIPLDDTSPVTTTQTTAIPIQPDVPIVNNLHAFTPDFVLSPNSYGASVDISINVKGDHLTLGMALSVNSDNKHIMLNHMLPSTPAHRLP